MCFAIPLKIIRIDKNRAQMEDGRWVKLGNIQAGSGDYLQVYADAAVEKLTKQNAIKVRRLIKKVN